MKTKYYIILCLLTIHIGLLFGQSPDNVISIMKKEVDRGLNLKIDNLQSPFFISYSLLELEIVSIKARLGAIETSETIKQRLGYPFLFVGNYERNDLNFAENSNNGLFLLPYENDETGIRIPIWQGLDSRYKSSAERYESKLTSIRQVQAKEEDLNLPDFEKREPFHFIQQTNKQKIDKDYWENYARKASEIVKKYPEINSSSVSVDLMDMQTYYYNTENTRYFTFTPAYSLSISLSTLTEDGQDLTESEDLEYSSMDEIPTLDEFVSICENFIAYFLELRNAPMIEEIYIGPVLFEEMALAQVFNSQLVRTSLIAKRNPIGKDMGNSSEMMMGKKMVSRSLSVKSLTGTEFFNGQRLTGYIPVDAEGVTPDKELVLVEDGVLKNMLNRRIPTKKVPESNGHARFQFSNPNITIAPGNIQLLSNNVYSYSELKQRLIDAAKEEDLDYAYIVRRMEKNNVLAIYKVYLEDGREELQRGSSLQYFNTRSFNRVLGATDTNFVYNTFSSGSMTTFIVPQALLFEEVEVTRNSKITLKKPFIIPQPK